MLIGMKGTSDAYHWGQMFPQGYSLPFKTGAMMCSFRVKSVQSALSDLLTTSATHGTLSRPSTKGGLILIGLELNTNARESFEHC